MPSTTPTAYEYIFIDFEFRQKDGVEGNPYEVICMVALNFRTLQYIRLWADELYQLREHPFGNNENLVLVAYFASAEMNCYKALGWSWPENILDLYAEFRCLTNGQPPFFGNSLLGALKSFGIQICEPVHKDLMRSLALRGGPYTADEKTDLLDYCQSDVDSLELLLKAMGGSIDLPRALLRGAYAIPLAMMESNGIPIEMGIYRSLCQNWDLIKAELIKQIDKDYGIYEKGVFKEVRLEAYLAQNHIPWERHESGRLKLDEETFKLMSKIYPQLAPLRKLRDSLAKLRLNALQVGSDGRNRCLLSPFSSTTGRNQPSTNKFVFGLSKWARGLIQPMPGRALAYIDWSQQEFGVAAALSKDIHMMAAYESGDPYLAFAKQAGAVPEDATKKSYPQEREQYKLCVLATQYGMGAEALAQSLKQPVIRARQLLAAHRRIYKQFWEWSDNAYNHAISTNSIQTVYGWRQIVKPDLNPRSIRNFPMQANSAEMLRIACILMAGRGIYMCAPVHDAILIESDEDAIDQEVKIAMECMTQASRYVLNGFELGSETEVIRYPDRFLSDADLDFWNQVISINEKVQNITPTYN